MTIASNLRRNGADKVMVVDTASGTIAAKYDVGTDPGQFIINKDGSRLTG
jgi:DNA-binding beta-propeller fold protein YncE